MEWVTREQKGYDFLSEVFNTAEMIFIIKLDGL